MKMDLGEVVCDAGDLIKVPKDRIQWRTYVRAVTNVRVP